MTQRLKIVYIVESRFNERDYKRYGIEILQTNNFIVEIWDFTPFLQPLKWENSIIKDPINLHNYKLFSVQTAALDAIKGLAKSTIIVALFGYSINSLQIFKAISRAGLKYCLFVANALPIPSIYSAKKAKLSLFAFLRNKFNNVSFTKVCNFFLARLPFYWIGIKPATFLLAGGEKSAILYKYPIGIDTETIWLHSLDYDLFLEDKHHVNDSEKSFGVFLDENVPFHTDFFQMGIKPFYADNPEYYYSILCDSFLEIERNTGAEIVIAAHPRSLYEKGPDYFGGRKVIRGQTQKLIKQCKFVILHSSTALNFAVLYKKPMIFITTNELRKEPITGCVDFVSHLFKKQAINIEVEKNIDFNKELAVDNKTYCDYKNQYIKRNGSEDRLFWQIFADRLKKLEYGSN